MNIKIHDERVHKLIPEEDDGVDNAIWFELEEMAQNMGTLCKLKVTFSGTHQLQHQHQEVDQADIPHGQIPALGPTKNSQEKYSYQTYK